jgi:hypothetical protein
MKMSPHLHRAVITRAGLLVALAILGIANVPQARADTMTLLADTTMVTGTQSAVFSFTAPSTGTITANLQNLNWQKPLSSLTFSATSGADVMSSWDATGSQVETFQVTGGNYFAHIMATTADAMDVGLYSLNLTFTPSVPLPASSWLLVTGIFGMFLFSRARRSLGLH